MEPTAEQLREKIAGLKKELTELESKIPIHSVRPHQLQAVEDLEEEIGRLEKKLNSLAGNVF